MWHVKETGKMRTGLAGDLRERKLLLDLHVDERIILK
jgi:hypothetical protein